MDDSDSTLEEIPWVPIVVGQKDPNTFDNRAWTTEPGKLAKHELPLTNDATNALYNLKQYELHVPIETKLSDKFPIDIVIGLKYLTNVYKVVVDVNNDMIPSKIEVSVGRGAENCGNDVESAKAADFGVKGSLEYKTRDRAGSRLEGRSLFTDHIGHFVWLVVHKPLITVRNPKKLVGIDRVLVLGYPVEKSRPRKAPPRTRNNNRTTRASSAGNRSGDVPARSSSSVPPPAYNPSPLAAPSSYSEEIPPEYVISRYSYEGDGMAFHDGAAMGSDALTSIRTVQRALTEKMKTAEGEGRDVEATVCLRALQRLQEYEVRIEDMAARRSDALTHGDTQRAERLRLSMIDARDTCFRAIHVDLLLNRHELRSIGVSSQWKEEVQDQ